MSAGRLSPRDLGRQDAARLRAEHDLATPVDDPGTLRALATILDRVQPVAHIAPRRARMASAKRARGTSRGGAS